SACPKVRPSSSSAASHTSRTAARSSTSSACTGGIAAGSRRSSTVPPKQPTRPPPAPLTSPTDGERPRARADRLGVARNVAGGAGGNCEDERDRLRQLRRLRGPADDERRRTPPDQGDL